MPPLRWFYYGKGSINSFSSKNIKSTSKQLKNNQRCIFAIPEIRNIPEKLHVCKKNENSSSFLIKTSLFIWVFNGSAK